MLTVPSNGFQSRPSMDKQVQFTVSPPPPPPANESSRHKSKATFKRRNVDDLSLPSGSSPNLSLFSADPVLTETTPIDTTSPNNMWAKTRRMTQAISLMSKSRFCASRSIDLNFCVLQLRETKRLCLRGVVLATESPVRRRRSSGSKCAPTTLHKVRQSLFCGPNLNVSFSRRPTRSQTSSSFVTVNTVTATPVKRKTRILKTPVVANEADWSRRSETPRSPLSTIRKSPKFSMTCRPASPRLSPKKSDMPLIHHPCTSNNELIRYIEEKRDLAEDLSKVFMSIGKEKKGLLKNRVSYKTFSVFLQAANLQLSEATTALSMLIMERGVTFMIFNLIMLCHVDDMDQAAFSENPSALIRELLDHTLLPYCNTITMHEKFEDKWLTKNNELDDYMYCRSFIISKIFSYFSASHNPQAPNKEVVCDSEGSRWMTTMTKDEFVEFARHIELFPRVVTGFMLTNVFLSASNGYVYHPLKINGSELLLIEPEFTDAVVRLSNAMAISGRLWHVLPQDAPTLAWVDLLFTLYIKPAYIKMTGFPMFSDLDDDILRAPLISSVSPIIGADEQVVIKGQRFCKKRGVSVRIGDIEVPCHIIHGSYVKFQMPLLQESELTEYRSTAFVHNGACTIEVYKQTIKEIFVKNNRSWVQPPKEYRYYWYRVLVGGFIVDPKVYALYARLHAMYAMQTHPECETLDQGQWKHVASLLGYPLNIKAYREAASQWLPPYGTEMITGVKKEDFISSLMTSYCLVHNPAADELVQLPSILTDHIADIEKSWEAETKLLALSTKSLPLETDVLPAKTVVKYDVFLGPMLVGEVGPECMFKSTIGPDTDLEVNHTLASCHNLWHCLKKLRALGFIPVYSQPRDIPYISRCWQIEKNNRPIGNVWDHGGTLSCEDWVTDAIHLYNPHLTVHLTVAHTNALFQNVFSVFKENPTPAQFIDALLIRGFLFMLLLPSSMR